MTAHGTGAGPAHGTGAGPAHGTGAGPAPARARARGLRRWLQRSWDTRPLDTVGSIKVKLGLLVVASTSATTLLTWYGLFVMNWWPRYTLPVAVLVSLAVTQVLAHGMTSPLRQMTAAAREMAVGRPPTAVRATSRDEVGELARAFIAMSRDIATADAQRRELLANVSHELRTPVAALRAQMENLVDGVRPADTEALAELLAQVERLGLLVDDLLDLARADAGVDPLYRCEVDVPALLADVVRQVSQARPGPRIVVDVPPGLTADADPARLRQVIVNLVDNAARYSPNGGRVDVIAGRDASRCLVLQVVDDGPGIPESQREAVFERFRSGGGAHVAGQGGGTGLGLAIARWAVTLHRGRIEVAPPEGRGCRIRVEIPQGPAEGPHGPEDRRPG